MSKVVIAMSGGVDSSVAAALLKQQGHELIGIMLRLWAEDGGSANKCCSLSAIDDARSVAVKLGIRFYVLDYQARFKTKIVDHFLQQHQLGLTPNPCFSCNREIRYGALLSEAKALGADFLATGHYVRKKITSTGYHQLLTAEDKLKDQSYMLYRLGQAQLKHALFPLGEYNKLMVRKIASELGLLPANKRDSQDLCFLGKDGQAGFMQRHLPHAMRPGPIKNQTGKIIGQHGGLAQYTIGQRKRLNLQVTKPHYVTAIDVANNTLTVGEDHQRKQNYVVLNNFFYNAPSKPSLPFACEARLRYKSALVKAQIFYWQAGVAKLHLASSLKDITPGQGLVLYDHEAVLGGGTIIRASYIQPEQPQHPAPAATVEL